MYFIFLHSATGTKNSYNFLCLSRTFQVCPLCHSGLPVGKPCKSPMWYGLVNYLTVPMPLSIYKTCLFFLFQTNPIRKTIQTLFQSKQLVPKVNSQYHGYSNHPPSSYKKLTSQYPGYRLFLPKSPTHPGVLSGHVFQHLVPLPPWVS